MDAHKDEYAQPQTPAVYCDVQNCTFHDGKELCTANKIHVGPTHAISSTDTACVTFKPAKN